MSASDQHTMVELYSGWIVEEISPRSIVVWLHVTPGEELVEWRNYALAHERKVVIYQTRI
jgi:hypothetical protein